jgi:hypothetical protein
MKALTMSDLRKKGDVPLTPRDRHTMNIGSGNYNRFAPLLSAPPGRPRINSKRKFADDSDHGMPKTPRLDANVVFDQLKGSEDVVSEIRTTLAEALKVGESCYSATDGGMGEAFFKLAKTVDLLIGNQEKILSAVVDAMSVLDKHSTTSYASAVKGHGKPHASMASATPHEDPHPSVLKVKKLKQAISKAERSVTLFDLDLGSVPVLNRDTLSKKVTLVLHERAQSEGIYKGNPAAAEEAIDDILSCASIDILGRGSKVFYNKKDNNDDRNGKMCTVPVKLSFKDKNTRFQAELALKKACKVKCATPYPKELRVLMDKLVKECKPENHGSFILARVDAEKLMITARARNDKGWVDLDRSVPIPVDLLDSAELEAASADDVTDMATDS